jgi:hypothetical protein
MEDKYSKGKKTDNVRRNEGNEDRETETRKQNIYECKKNQRKKDGKTGIR